MTVKQLIQQLLLQPQDATVLRRGDEFNGDTRVIGAVTYHERPTLGCKANTVVLD